MKAEDCYFGRHLGFETIWACELSQISCSYIETYFVPGHPKFMWVEDRRINNAYRIYLFLPLERANFCSLCVWDYQITNYAAFLSNSEPNISLNLRTILPSPSLECQRILLSRATIWNFTVLGDVSDLKCLLVLDDFHLIDEKISFGYIFILKPNLKPPTIEK